MFAALLDTSVLWPSLQRDFLLSLAIESLYRPVWSSAILDELQFHEARKLIDRGCEPDETARQSQRLIDQMSTAFDDASVENWEPLNGTFGLPDPDDEHVVRVHLIAAVERFASGPTTNTDGACDLPMITLPSTLTTMDLQHGYRSTGLLDH